MKAFSFKYLGFVATTGANILFLLLFLSIFLISCGDQKGQEAYQFFIRGNEQLLKANYPEAIRFYDEALKKKPEFPEALTNRGVAHTQRGEMDQAIEDLNNSLKINNKVGNTYQARGNYFTLTGDFAKARQDLEEAVKLIPDSSASWALLGNAQYMSGQEEQAFQSFDRAVKVRPSDYSIYAFRGWIYVLRKEYDKAAADFRQALKYRPDEPSTVNNLSMVTTQLGDAQEGLKIADKAVKITEGKLLAYAVNNRAFALLELNRPDDAKPELDRSIRLDDQNAWAYRNLGIYYLKKQQHAEALAQLLKAEKMDPSVDDLYFYLGSAYKAAGRSDQACTSFRRGVTLREKKSAEAVKSCR